MKYDLVMPISVARASLDLPKSTMSSAKKTEEMFRGPRSMPRPEELSSEPRLFIKRANSNGDKLQPESELLRFNFSPYRQITLLHSLRKEKLFRVMTIKKEF